MEETDLAFENSDVEADIKGSVISIKNPKSGTIIADSIDEIVQDNPINQTAAKILIRTTPDAHSISVYSQDH
jgi:hypothetical protein